jgi:hypothetical protein
MLVIGIDEKNRKIIVFGHDLLPVLKLCSKFLFCRCKCFHKTASYLPCFVPLSRVYFWWIVSNVKKILVPKYLLKRINKQNDDSVTDGVSSLGGRAWWFFIFFDWQFYLICLLVFRQDCKPNTIITWEITLGKFIGE